LVVMIPGIISMFAKGSSYDPRRRAVAPPMRGGRRAEDRAFPITGSGTAR
jgi:hypothetical protein